MDIVIDRTLEIKSLIRERIKIHEGAIEAHLHNINPASVIIISETQKIFDALNEKLEQEHLEIEDAFPVIDSIFSGVHHS